MNMDGEETLIITGARVINPATNMDEEMDILVRGRKICTLSRSPLLPPPQSACTVFNARGCLLVPGLIDAHVHVLQHATPLGVNADTHCLSRGVTTVVDAGSSGSATFPGLRKYIIEKSQTRVLALLHIANHGLASAGCSGPGCGGGECDSLNQVNVASCVDVINQNRDIIVGIKVRLSTSITNDGQFEEEVYRRALAASKQVGLPLMTHHALSSVPNFQAEGLSCPGSLKRGDIYTHCFHPHQNALVDSDGKVKAGVKEVKDRGVLLDVGHGQGAFSWRVAEIMGQQGVWPDIISTDLHTGNISGPAYDLPTVMTKFMTLGMPLNDIIKAVTSNPAAAFNRADTLGSLEEGREADMTLLKLVDCDILMEDITGEVRRVTRRLVPVAVWRAGKHHLVTSPDLWPNPASRQRCHDNWHQNFAHLSELKQ